MKREPYRDNPYLALRFPRRLPPHSQGWADCNREARDARNFGREVAWAALFMALGAAILWLVLAIRGAV